MPDDIANLIPTVKVHEQEKRSDQTSSCISCSLWGYTSQSDAEAISNDKASACSESDKRYVYLV